MANQPMSSTAGAPAGTILGGPVRVLPTMDSRSDTGTWAMAYPLGPFMFDNKVSNGSSNMFFGGRMTLTTGVTRIVAPKPGIIVGVSASRNTAPTAGTWQTKAMIGATSVLNVTATSLRSTYTFSTNLSSAARTYAAGNLLGVKLVTNAAYSAETGDFAAFLWVI